MKKTTAIGIILIIILIGIVSFLYLSHRKHSGSAQPAVTDVIHFAPSADQGNEPNEQGTCWTGSIAAPFREDAWRCMVGNEIADPCFQTADKNKLLCAPTGNDDDNFMLTLTEPLPAPVAPTGTVPTGWAWKMELSDGTTCTPFTGTGTFTADGQSGFYGCDDGTTLLGYPNNSLPLWTVTKAVLSDSTNGLPTVTSSKVVSVKTVWQ